MTGMIIALSSLTLALIVVGAAECRKFRDRYLGWARDEIPDSRRPIERADLRPSDPPAAAVAAEPVAAAVEDEGPRWRHDCAYCMFLGRFECYDLYACKGIKGVINAATKEYTDTLFADNGDENLAHPALIEAHRRAVARGLIADATTTSTTP